MAKDRADITLLSHFVGWVNDNVNPSEIDKDSRAILEASTFISGQLTGWAKGGRPSVYATPADKQRAYRQRKRAMRQKANDKHVLKGIKPKPTP